MYLCRMYLYLVPGPGTKAPTANRGRRRQMRGSWRYLLPSETAEPSNNLIPMSISKFISMSISKPKLLRRHPSPQPRYPATIPCTHPPSPPHVRLHACNDGQRTGGTGRQQQASMSHHEPAGTHPSPSSGSREQAAATRSREQANTTQQ